MQEAIIPMTLRGMIIIQGIRLIQWGRRNQMAMEYMTFLGMYGSGVRIGMIAGITLIVHTGIQRDRHQALPGFIALALGSATRGSSGVRIGSGSRRAAGTSTSGFVLPVDFWSAFSV